MVVVNMAVLPWRHRRLRAELPARASACAATVTRYLGEDLPPTTVTLTTRSGLAWLHVAANSAGATLRARAWYHWTTYREARDAAAVTVAAPDGTVRILLDSAVLATRTDREVDGYLTHELVHAVQYARRGQHARLVAGERHNLGLQQLPDTAVAQGRAAAAAFEAEAYRVQHELVPIP
ncbi:hypothetical protein ACFV3E_41870 [Streptomyces sp. NPDC059718]